MMTTSLLNDKTGQRILKYLKQLPLVIIVVFSQIAVTASAVTADTIFSRIDHQREIFPQEKAYLMTDRDNYLGGDTIWFRAFIMDASTHIEVNASRYVYVELINPMGITEQRIMARNNNGTYSGYIKVPADISDGKYDLIAYTRFMQSQSPDFFPRKKVTLLNIRSIKDEIVHRWDSRNRRLSLSYLDKTTGKPRQYNEMNLRSDGGKEFSSSGSPDAINIKIKPEDLINGWIQVRYDDYQKFVHLDNMHETEEYDLTFFPEGGYIIDGVPCRIAFKSISADGMSRDAEGNIVDESGTEVAQYKSQHAGMGSLVLTLDKDKKYYAIDNGGKKVELPSATKRASVLQVHNRFADTLKITVAGERTNGMSLLMQQRGIPLTYTRLDDIDTIKFARASCPPGIIQMTLFDDSMHKLSERLIFIADHNNHQPEIVPNRISYKNREHVKICGIFDSIRPPKGNYAVSVTDRNSTVHDSNANIVYHTLLQSDLKGHIEDVGYYFSSTVEAVEALDDLLLTQGWKRYDIPETVKGHYSKPNTQIETDMAITGYVHSLWKNKAVSDATVSLMSPNTGYVAMTETDNDGRFIFDGFELPENSRFLIQAINHDGKTERNIIVDPSDYPNLQYRQDFSYEICNKVSPIEKMRIESNPELSSILLSEVVVTGQKKPESETTWYDLITESRQYDTEDKDYTYISTIEEALRKIHGIQVRNDGSIMFRGKTVAVYVDDIYIDLGHVSTGPLPLFEGKPPTKGKKIFRKGNKSTHWVMGDGLGVLGSNDNQLRAIEDICPYSTIKKITFLIPGEAVALGFKAANGALMIQTKKDAGKLHDTWDNGIREAHVPGYQKPAEFYSPRYTPDSHIDGSDLRATIYWNPKIEIGDDGKSEIEFYTTDAQSTTYDIVIEGITDTGTPFSSRSTLAIE